MENPKELPANAMKVALVCHSDLLGGASMVTYRLMYALRRLGIDARMVVFTKTSDDPNVLKISSRFVRGTTFMFEHARIALANGFSRNNLFKVSIANIGVPLHRHSWVKEADVVMLSWVNQGMLSLKEVGRLASMGKPVVWSMHDMWNLTGICHHAYECRGYKGECGNCQFLLGNSAKDLSHKIWKKKKNLYALHKITFVAVSNWLAEKCRESSLMRDADIRVINNAFPIESFTIEPTVRLDNLGLKKNVIIMGAVRLDDPIKGLKYAIAALNYLFDNNPELARDTEMVFFGEIRNKSLLDTLRFPHRCLGKIQDPSLLREFYARSRVVLSTSLYETLPGTIIEGMAAGCVPVSFGKGGQREIFTHLQTGYIAEYKNSIDVAAGIKWALSAPVEPMKLHDEVREKFAFSRISQEYAELFQSLLQKPMVNNQENV